MALSSHPCDRARRWAALAPDGRLSELESRLLRRHLNTCPDCQAFASLVDSFTEEIRSSPLQPPTTGSLRLAGMRRMRTGRRRALRVTVGRGLGTVATGAVVVMASVIGLRAVDRPHPSVAPGRTLVVIVSGDDDLRPLTRASKNAAYSRAGKLGGVINEDRGPRPGTV